jgi:uncharacterized protein (TIGR02466 family)
MNTLIASKWFGNPIWEIELTDIDNDSIVEYAYSLEKNNDVKSNRGGWQFYDLKNPTLPYLQLIDVCNQAVMDAHLSMGLKEEFPSYINGSWININPPQSYNVKHLHPRSLFSGVYYAKVPQGDCGDITFHRDPLPLSYIPNYIVQDWNDLTSGTATYKIKTGTLLIFPSWLEHSVSPNFTNEDRISIAFNTNYNF